MLEACKHNVGVLLYAPAALMRDKDFMLEACKHNVSALWYASAALNGDKDFMLEACKHNGLALQYASKALKEDIKVVLTAVRQNGLALQYSHVGLDYLLSRTPPGFAGMATNFFLGLVINDEAGKQVVLAAVKQNGLALQYASVKMRYDKDVVFAAIRQNGAAIQFAHVMTVIPYDKKYFLEAVKQNIEVIKYLPQALIEDKEFMRKAQLDAIKPDEIRARFKRKLSKTEPQNLTDEQLHQIDSQMQALENEMQASTNTIIIGRKKEHIGMLAELKTLSKTMDVLSAIEQIEADERFNHVKSGTGSRTQLLMDEIKGKCSKSELKKQ